MPVLPKWYDINKDSDKQKYIRCSLDYTMELKDIKINDLKGKVLKEIIINEDKEKYFLIQETRPL